MQNRRVFLGSMMASGLAAQAGWAAVGKPTYLAAAERSDGRFVLCGLTDNGNITFQVPLPARGHAAAAHPNRAEAVGFARRPGNFAVVVDCVDGTEIKRIEAPEGRHFYGHGAYSVTGRLLFTTENDYANARGVIGVWDADENYTRIGEFDSGGVGPHDIQLMPDGKTLVVANGGIETHPDTGRAKLNIPMMESNLTYLNLSGGIVEQVKLMPAYQKNSIRHLAVAADGTVAFAMQWQGESSAALELVGIHRRGSAVQLMKSSSENLRNLGGYVGSIAISDKHSCVAATSPRGGCMQTFDLDTMSLTTETKIEDVCGLAVSSEGFCATNGLGMVVSHAATPDVHVVQYGLKWDNHVVPV